MYMYAEWITGVVGNVYKLTRNLCNIFQVVPDHSTEEQ